MEFEKRLPLDVNKFKFNTETVGSRVGFPVEGELVVKISKNEPVTTDLEKALDRVRELKKREEVAFETASETTKEAIVPQEYVLASGAEEGTNRIVRIQQLVRGQPLRKLGFKGIVSMDDNHIDSLKNILRDSMKCFMSHGTNYDLFGSDERDELRNKRTLNIKRIIFPLRNSSNLIYTDKGIKLVDPNVLGVPDKVTPKSFAIQSVLFASSAINYAILDSSQNIRHLKSKFVKSKEVLSE